MGQEAAFFLKTTSKKRHHIERFSFLQMRDGAFSAGVTVLMGTYKDWAAKDLSQYRYISELWLAGLFGAGVNQMDFGCAAFV